MLAVSQQGGHLMELLELTARMPAAAAGVDWVTFDTPQARSLLAGRPVAFIRPVYPRDVRSTAVNLLDALRRVRRARYGHVVASGNVALSFLPVAASRRIGAHFVESVTRIHEPSVTGRLVGFVPGVRTYTQWPSAAGGRWAFRGSVFDGFSAAAAARRPLRRIVVSLGMNPYPFRRLLERLITIVPSDAEVLWQTGTTDTTGLGIPARRTVPGAELRAAIASADVVVAHAGVGSALQALECGKLPVLVPRVAALGEQVDDHQLELVRWLERTGLAVGSGADAVALSHLEHAAGSAVVRRAEPPAFDLG